MLEDVIKMTIKLLKRSIDYANTRMAHSATELLRDQDFFAKTLLDIDHANEIITFLEDVQKRFYPDTILVDRLGSKKLLSMFHKK